MYVNRYVCYIRKLWIHFGDRTCDCVGVREFLISRTHTRTNKSATSLFYLILPTTNTTPEATAYI